MRIGLGCLRLASEPDQGRATIRAALDEGIEVFDTARAYGESERVLGEVIRAHPAGARARIVTKCGMRRDGEAWVPDGRARAILEDASASVEALERPVDLLLLHAPDPRVPLATSLRALERARSLGATRRIGVSNVSRKQLDEAGVALAAVEVALGPHDDEAARGGVVSWCVAEGAEVLAYAPLGGPKHAKKLANDTKLRALAERLDASCAEVVLAYLLALSPAIVPLVGARTPEQIRSAARASRIVLDDAALAELDERFPRLATVRRAPSSPRSDGADVVMLMGIAGAGKTRAVEAWTARGYERLNRDTLGGTLRGIAQRLDATLTAGAKKVVLDNTYVTRAMRSDVLRVAGAHGAGVRCVFFDTPLAEAQINVTLRMLERHGALLGPQELKAAAKKDPNMVMPGALFRMARELEPPAADEGFAAIEVQPFVREEAEGVAGVAIAAELLRRAEPAELVRRAGGPVLVFGWDASGRPPPVVEGAEVAFCTHPAGPPVCWCRPPLPGLFLAFARRHGVDPRKSVMLGASAAHRTMARALGIAYEEGTR